VVTTGRVAVVGGSLGGLTSALLLRDAGFDVTIYERSGAELEQRGAGIGFLPDASRYLSERAGVDLDDISISTDHIRYFNRDGTIEHDIEHSSRLSYSDASDPIATFLDGRSSAGPSTPIP
jgi:2,6-dihydroxypyridine 3-monooxygenase